LASQSGMSRFIYIFSRKVTSALLFPCSPQRESLRFSGHENDE